MVGRAPASSGRDARVRRVYIDWLRGIAVLIMIMWHAIDSWHVREGRATLSFQTITFLAGWAAPLFLFLAGVSLPMAGLSRMARGADRRAAARALMLRGGQVVLIAHLFRLQSFLLNPNARWSGLLKPDILNILGLGMVAVAFCWGRAETDRTRVWWLLVPALAIVLVLAPLAPTWWWPTLLHPRLEAYIRPVGNMGVFSLFPAVGYLFAGAFAGAVLAERRWTSEALFHRRAVAWGVALVAIGTALSFVAMPSALVMWTKPFTVFAWRSGGMLCLLVASWWWLQTREARANGPLLVFGRTSLFVYWVHVELAYGAFSYPIRGALTLPWAVAAYLLFTAAMYFCARAWLARPAGPLIPAHMRAAQ